jgi:hypothetical protein
MTVYDKFKINLNQNLWGLVASYVALGAAEYWELKHLLCLSFIMAIFLSVSVVVTSGFYTWEYCHGKFHDIADRRRNAKKL